MPLIATAPPAPTVLKIGYYLQVVAAFLLLCVVHYFAAGFLPPMDVDEIMNSLEPIHYLLYGSGKQVWELCSLYALRSWLFFWMYAWPAVFLRGVSSLSSVDVYFFLRIFNGRIAALAELFFVYSVWSAFSGNAAMVALFLLLFNVPIASAATGALQTSYAMIFYFAVLGCWLRTGSWTSRSMHRNNSGGAADPLPAAVKDMHASRSSRAVVAPTTLPPRWLLVNVTCTILFILLGCFVCWPFMGLIAVPVCVDLLVRFPRPVLVSVVLFSVLISGACILVDRHYYGHWAFSTLNLIKYNVFSDSENGSHKFGVEPWYFFFKSLLLEFNILFPVVMAAPVVVLFAPKRRRVLEVLKTGGWTGVGTPYKSDAAVPKPLSSSTSTGGLPAAAATPGSLPRPVLSRGRELLYILPFFLWFVFWLFIPHKETRFMMPAYPFFVLAAVRCIYFLFFSDGWVKADRASNSSPFLSSYNGNGVTATVAEAHGPAPSKRRLLCRRLSGLLVLLCFATISYSRALAIYHFYSGPQRLFYDWYPLLQAEAEAKYRRSIAEPTVSATVVSTDVSVAQQKMESQAYFIVCVGAEWFRFPSSFFIDSHFARHQGIGAYQQHGFLPVSFLTPKPGSEEGFLLRRDKKEATVDMDSKYGSRTCGFGDAHGVPHKRRDLGPQNLTAECDLVFDSISATSHASPEVVKAEQQALHIEDVFTTSALRREDLRRVLEGRKELYHEVDDSYAILDVSRTPTWCRILYYPFGITDRCAVWRPLVLRRRPPAESEELRGKAVP